VTKAGLLKSKSDQNNGKFDRRKEKKDKALEREWMQGGRTGKGKNGLKKVMKKWFCLGVSDEHRPHAGDHLGQRRRKGKGGGMRVR